jgi:hypothetical protein
VYTWGIQGAQVPQQKGKTMTTKTINNIELTTLELDYNSRVYVQRKIYSYMQNNELTEMQTFTYNQLIDLMQDATIWVSANERAILSALVSKDLTRTDITPTQRNNVKSVLNILGKAGN